MSYNFIVIFLTLKLFLFMLELKKIYKSYQVDKVYFPALKNINLSFAEKGFVSILGPSGCGKTTLLNLIGGLDQYNKGDLLIDGKSTKKFNDHDWDAYRNKKIGFVFQTYNLVPHLTILANVELSLTLTGASKKERVSKAMKALKHVGLKDMAKKKPNQLSGGQMQRVAIARALVNDPEIILADEPTGALDSVTSVQVMELLAQVSKERLVIMVTHNIELAEKYSTRIIKLKDGKVTKDSAPIKTEEQTKEIQKAKNEHTHMSFFTALGNSFKNLMTKKGRTTLTAIAASFGIIGVALVLAMSNGFTKYVYRIESSTASTVPITIAPFVTTDVKRSVTPKAWPDEPVIKPYSEDISSLMVVHHNNITPEYANYCKNLLKEPNRYASSVLENHEYLDFNIFTKRRGDGEIIKVDQFSSAGAISSIISGTTNLPSTIFHELYGNKNYIDSLYDVIAGSYPNEELIDNGDGTFTSEVCLVCDRYNEIPIKTLFNLGLTQTDQTREGETISFNDLIGHEYHSYLPDKVFKAVKQTPCETNIDVYNLKPNASGVITLYPLDPSFGQFSEGTTTKTIKSYVDVTAKREDGKYSYEDALKNLYTRPDIIIKIKGILRIKKDTTINLMPGSIAYPASLKNYYVSQLQQERFNEYKEIAKQNWGILSTGDRDKDQTNWKEFMLSFIAALANNNVSAITSYLNSESSPIAFYDTLINKDKIPERDNSSRPYTTFQRNNYRFSNDFKQPDIVYAEIEGTKIPIGYNPSSVDGFIDVANYVNSYSTITSILIFARDLSCKKNVFNYLNAWNVGKDEKQQIKYSDVAGTLTDIIGNITNIVSIVLVCFSAISLLVSCVMTGVITYTSVLERTKEIGILRAIGARKKDVGRLFEAESVIVGLFGGLIGIVITYIFEYPISLLIAKIAPEQQVGLICDLNPLHALILVLISALLTFLAGFIPARKASKKDPVVALRSE